MAEEHPVVSPGAEDRADIRARLGGEFTGLLSSIGATEAVRPLAEATASVFRDSRELESVIDQYANANPGHLQGRALEFLEVLKFNRAAAEAGSSLQAVATHFNDPAAAADVLIRDGQDVLKQVQAKSYGQAAETCVLVWGHEQDNNGHSSD